MNVDLLADVTSMPVRRDVQGIRQLITELRAGDTVRAVFKTARYGPFAIDGVVRSSEGGQLMVADQFIGTPSRTEGTPSRVENDLQRLRIVAPNDEPVAAEEAEVTDIGHGDLVRAWFETPTHGRFAITGLATRGEDRFALVGNWILVDGVHVAPRVASIEAIVREVDHDLTVARRTGSLALTEE